MHWVLKLLLFEIGKPKDKEKYIKLNNKKFRFDCNLFYFLFF